MTTAHRKEWVQTSRKKNRRTKIVTTPANVVPNIHLISSISLVNRVSSCFFDFLPHHSVILFKFLSDQSHLLPDQVDVLLEFLSNCGDVLFKFLSDQSHLLPDRVDVLLEFLSNCGDVLFEFLSNCGDVLFEFLFEQGKIFCLVTRSCKPACRASDKAATCGPRPPRQKRLPA